MNENAVCMILTRRYGSGIDSAEEGTAGQMTIQYMDMNSTNSSRNSTNFNTFLLKF